MKKRTIVGLLAICCVWGAAANAAQAPTTACDRECLRGKITQLLYALVKHDVSGLPVAATLRVTEDAVEKPLAKVGLVGTVTRLRGFRQDIIDERAGVAGADVIVEETGAPVMLVVRLKVVADKLTEIELVATRSRAEGLIFNIDGLSAPSAVMNYAPRPGQLATRDEAIKAALHYPQGLNAAKTFAAVNAPFAPDAYRYENGQVMAGPDCKFAPRLSEYLHPVARDLRAPRRRADPRRRRRRAHGHRLAAHGLGRARARRRSADGVGVIQGLRRPDPRRGSVHADPAVREAQRRMGP